MDTSGEGVGVGVVGKSVGGGRTEDSFGASGSVGAVGKGVEMQ